MTRTIGLLARWTLVSSLVLVLAVTTMSVTPPAQAQTVRPDFFGMHDRQISNGSQPGVPTGATRLWDTGTTWREIEKQPGVYEWGNTDRAVDAAEAAGLRPLLVLGQTPQFHATDPTVAGAHGAGASSMPGTAGTPDTQAWTRYVSAVATRYQDRVDYQIWNEPNVVSYWTGTPAQMATLTGSASAAVEAAMLPEADPTIVAPSFPLRLKSQRIWYDTYWSKTYSGRSMAAYVDVVSANLYPSEKAGPEAQLPLLRFARSALPEAARSKPIWNTEINFGLRGGLTARRISEARQAAYVARTLVLNAASPVRRVYWYSWGQGRIANTHLGNADGTLTRAGRAWQRVHGWLLGTDTKGCKQARRGRTKGVYTCTARESRREVRRFYWKPSGRAATIRTPRTTSRWTELSGKVHRRRGSYGIKVGQTPVMVTSRR